MISDLQIEKPCRLRHEPHGTYRYGQEIDTEFGGTQHVKLSLNKKGITKVVVLADIHFPYHISLDSIFRFILDFKPHYIVLNGDICDWNCFSPHAPCSKEIPLPFKAHQDFALGLIKKLQKTSKVIWVQGNHEDWCRQAVVANPAIEGMVEPHLWLPKSVEYVPLNHCVQIGKLRIFHGNCLRNERVDRPTVSMFKQWSDSHMLFGHFHKVELHTQKSEASSDKRFSFMQGCLCKINPSYARNMPSGVTNGFSYLVFEKKGDFWLYLTPIHHGKFIAEGKVYE